MKIVVKVKRGINITKGYWGDKLDTPDPYVVCYLAGSAEHYQRTATIDNEANPVWNETLTFLFDVDRNSIMKIKLMDANYTVDERLGEQIFAIYEHLNVGQTKTVMLNFFETSQVEFDFSLEIAKPDLRFSLALCDEEKEFLEARREKVFENMQTFLGERAPTSIHQAPTVAVLGSGGGFRAMVAFSGVFDALTECGILGVTTYAAGLSGSSWYMSTLYSHPAWPGTPPGALQDELRSNIDSKVSELLTIGSMTRYVDTIVRKRMQGQPISFTDFFGHLVGETLLKDRMNVKLSDQVERIKDGDVPMPLYTCLHVKKSVSAMLFHEWLEFSPYEVGMAKYGTFMSTKLFGSKFFMGCVVRQYPESPLHFLQGLWGSAFCILFKRLLRDDKSRKMDPVEIMRQELEASRLAAEASDRSDNDSGGESDTDDDERETATLDGALNRREKKESIWKNALAAVFTSSGVPLLRSRTGRAGMVHNFMRGLSLTQLFPYSPFTPAELTQSTSPVFKCIHEALKTEEKLLFLVDSGLTFNSPYPLLLRPQRAVDVLLSFDFSARPSDSSQPFKELKLAEAWALKNGLPFPPIDVGKFDREGMKEVYVFRHPTDEYCPIVVHFVLVNIEFRTFLTPGVPRRTDEEREFADFDIFDDADAPYSTFNFTYTHRAFLRLSQLMRFNTLLGVDVVKDVLADVVQKKRTNPPECFVRLNSFRHVRMRRKEKQKLRKYVEDFRRSGVGGYDDLVKELDSVIEQRSSVEDGRADLARELDELIEKRSSTVDNRDDRLRDSDNIVDDRSPIEGDTDELVNELSAYIEKRSSTALRPSELTKELDDLIGERSPIEGGTDKLGDEIGAFLELRSSTDACAATTSIGERLRFYSASEDFSADDDDDHGGESTYASPT
ncbi:PREDICTED: cytosolic phospholipase A2-like [Priapulus caudatus]|uniref:Phospholipase A2 n=1 Tax=Priapulus caudatus TaxID=37621 RepID=A0ABM1E956_PRICU|nr:PREDICTED: cytosolic phospholipase A2-like [Priapulus caudatus]